MFQRHLEGNGLKQAFAFWRQSAKGAASEGHKSQHAFACLNFPFIVGLTAFHFEGMSFIHNVLC